MGETKLPPKVCDAKNEAQNQNTTVLEPQYEVWKPDRLNRALSELNNDDKKTLFLYRTINSIFNKVTPENFYKLEDKVKNLSIDTPTRMQGVIDIIHKKVINEWKFRSLYAKLCNLMRNIQILNKEGAAQSFGQLLIAKCETHFDKSFDKDLEFNKRRREIDSCTDRETRKFLKREYDLEESQVRKQSVENCHFIGELFKLDMIHSNRIFQILDRLFESGRNMCIECICAIITNIGEFYEKNVENFPEEYFEKINVLLAQQGLKPRIRCLLQNVLDLRNNSWCPRLKLELPKTLEQIEQDLLDEENSSEQLGSKNRVKSSKKSKKKRNKFNKGTSR
ncbi:eukaryotic translation initiation factor 4 gamma 1-like [Planococcus citri]|uniref:eukaryotic translation initiation factor 4 gamma 1-like n=1 Tax=Planococcus citri TaxID=170843 RepID=UPI0031F790D0